MSTLSSLIDEPLNRHYIGYRSERCYDNSATGLMLALALYIVKVGGSGDNLDGSDSAIWVDCCALPLGSQSC